MAQRSSTRWSIRPFSPGLFFILGLALWPGALAGGQEPSAPGKGPGKEPIELKADYLRYDEREKATEARGNVEASGADFVLRSDLLRLLDDEKLLQAEGRCHLRVTGKEKANIFGEKVTYHYEKKEGEAWEIYSEKGEIRSWAETMRFREERQDFQTATFTTCDKEQPHYRLVSARMVHIPQNKVVARRIDFFVGKTHLLRIPYYMASLKKRKRQPLAPQVGHNQFEGFFVKTTLAYEVAAGVGGLLLADWMQKKGTGLGFDQDFSLRKGGSARLYLYQLQNPARTQKQLTSEASLNRPWRGGKANLSWKQENIIGLSLQEVSRQTGQVQYSHRTRRTSQDLSLMHSESGSLLRLGQQQVSLQFQHAPLKGVSAQHTLKGHRQEKSADRPNLEMSAATTLGYAKGAYTYQLSLAKRVDLDGSRYGPDNTFGFLDKLPELVVKRSGRGRLLAPNADLLLAFYREGPREPVVVEEGKGELTLAKSQTWRLDRRHSLAVAYQVQQAFYTQESAKFRLTYTPSLSIRHTPTLTSEHGFSYQKARGHTPFLVDRQDDFVSKQARSQLRWFSGKFEFTANTGFDFVNDHFATLVMVARYRSPRFGQLTLNATYDLEEGQGRQLTLMQRRDHQDLKSQVVMNYSWEKGALQTVDLNLGFPLFRKTYVEYRTRYHRPRDDFLFNDLVVSHDLHCWEGLAGYRSQRKEFFVQLWIKAFPATKPTFGFSESGVAVQDLGIPGL